MKRLIWKYALEVIRDDVPMGLRELRARPDHVSQRSLVCRPEGCVVGIY